MTLAKNSETDLILAKPAFVQALFSTSESKARVLQIDSLVAGQREDFVHRGSSFARTLWTVDGIQ